MVCSFVYLNLKAKYITCSFHKCACWTEIVFMTCFVKFLGHISLFGQTVLVF
jgi:hypothetical protein